MVSFTVRLEFREEDREKIREFLRLITPPSRAEAGCVTYVPHFVEDGSPTLLIYEQYADEAALEAHRGSPHFAQYATDGFFKLVSGRKLERLEAIA
jgi:quinol monooxygenase YgiN